MIARDFTGTGKLKPFGSALDAKTDGRIPAVPFIINRVRKLRGSPACPECGNKGPWQCECPDE